MQSTCSVTMSDVMTLEADLPESDAPPFVTRLADLVIESMLERTDARRPRRSLEGPTPGVAVHVDLRCDDPDMLAPIGDLEGALRWLASLAVHRFVDRGFFATVRQDRALLFVHTLPYAPDYRDGDCDETTRFARRLDEDLLRSRIDEVAVDFVDVANRGLADWGLTVDVRLHEGTLDASGVTLSALTPSRLWVPLDLGAESIAA
jgi:hypothetical protein